ncbi:hypothetical protein BWD42_24190 [Sphingobacterium sp. CZ-UAM]|uniref:hypothetical protein n=1 Tax=Sphingobacterium sp. CZ-UAM TaxID=1933868 RepID=UPI000984C3EF|nr:hypothetical protein [Sphingobacterium sp. CZ-UAM]OOG15780.1 hypothetical protein BWD42_24190 [Sphingobacterium sp. CZ-UAM]
MRLISNFKTVCFSFFLLSSTVIHAQVTETNSDYLVLMNADTLYGKISSVKDRKLKFESLQKEKLTFTPDQVFRAYWKSKKKVYAPSYVENGLEPVPGTSPQTYQIRKTPDLEPTFAEVLVDGEIMAYYVSELHFGGSGGMMIGSGGAAPMIGVGFTKSKYAYALKKATGEVIEINSNSSGLFSSSKKKRTLTLGRLINDEPELFAEFEKEQKYNYDIFIKYIMRYNELQRSKESPLDSSRLFIY